MNNIGQNFVTTEVTLIITYCNSAKCHQDKCTVSQGQVTGEASWRREFAENGSVSRINGGGGGRGAQLSKCSHEQAVGLWDLSGEKAAASDRSSQILCTNLSPQAQLKCKLWFRKSRRGLEILHFPQARVMWRPWE